VGKLFLYNFEDLFWAQKDLPKKHQKVKVLMLFSPLFHPHFFWVFQKKMGVKSALDGDTPRYLQNLANSSKILKNRQKSSFFDPQPGGRKMAILAKNGLSLSIR